MIFTAIITVFLWVLSFIFSLIHLPLAPVVFTDAISSIVPWLSFPIVLVKNFVGDTFFEAMIVMILALFVFNGGIRPIIWVFNKIRGAGN